MKTGKALAMDILIIEQDRHAAEDLKKLLLEIDPEIKIAGTCTTVKEASQWLRSKRSPDLVFAAVELPDGVSFQLFRGPGKSIPVIFVCRHERYAIEAFRSNGIYYIMKPIKKQELLDALQRYNEGPAWKPSVARASSHYQKRFLVPSGKQLRLINTEDIAYFYTENKIVYLVTLDDSKYLTDYTLERLEQLLDPAMFFRINRQFIINISAIVKLEYANKSRYKVFLRPKTEHSTITSFARTEKFCSWMLGELTPANMTTAKP